MRIELSLGKSTAEAKLIGLCKVLAVWSVICLLLTLTTQQAEAHGNDRTLYLSDVPVGSYTLSAWTSPAVLRTGEIHVEVSLLDMDGVPVQDALIYVTVSPLDGMGEPLSVVAHPSHSNLAQEAAFWLEQPGRCRIEIAVADADGGVGNTTFDVEILSVPLIVQVLIYVQIVASFIAGIWILKMGTTVWLRSALH
jgi:hypothetical protein